MSMSAQTLSQLRVGLGMLLLGLLILVPLVARAEDEDPATVEKITSLNKQALDQYNNLEFEEARKLLKQALDLCSSAGLDKHAIKARTHVHMGVVLIAAKQQELGVKQFKKALEIQPDIQVTKALANPEIIQAFEEAAAAGPVAPTGGGTEEGGPEPAETAPPAEGDTTPESTADISHVPISRGKKGKPIAISVTVSPNLTGYTKVVLAYRAEGAEEFLSRDMQRSGNTFIGQIPAEATGGNIVTYYIDAEAEDESAVASSGSEEVPYSVSLSEGGGSQEGEEEGGDDEGPPFFLGLLGGWGIGYATGNGEVNADRPVTPGFASASAAQIAPEIGYFLAPGFRLSLQLRFQFVSGANAQNLDSYMKTLTPAELTKFNVNACGVDHRCSPATFATAAFARGTWFFGSGVFRPYFSLAVGGGQIRHVVTFKSLKTCGESGTQACVDTVLAGPIFAGPGGGALISLSPKLGFIVEINSVLGFPKFTFHLDFNAGVAARF